MCDGVIKEGEGGRRGADFVGYMRRSRKKRSFPRYMV